jgi:hypothetical protein
MSIYKTYKLSNSVVEYVELVTKITEPRSAKQQLDFLFKLSNELAYNYSCVNYFAPEIARRIIETLRSTNNTIEDAEAGGELDEIERIDYELMIQDAIERIQDATLPEKSFFFTWIDGEYFSVDVDEDGELVEGWKYDQKVESKKSYGNLKEWIDEYKINIEKIEVGMPIDSWEDDVYGEEDAE